MKIKDVELFIAGANEIERKREVIKRIFNTVSSLIRNTCSTNEKKWPEMYAIARINSSLWGEIRIVAGKKELIKRQEVIFQRCDPNGMIYDFNSLSYEIVPDLYMILPKIIETAHVAVPEAEIESYFDFFISQTLVE